MERLSPVDFLQRKEILTQVEAAEQMWRLGMPIRAVCHFSAALEQAKLFAQNNSSNADRFSYARILGGLGVLCHQVGYLQDSGDMLCQSEQILNTLLATTGDKLYAQARAFYAAMGDNACTGERWQFHQDFSQLLGRVMVLQEYHVYTDEEGIMLCLPYKLAGEVQDPYLYYDGGEHAVLWKNSRSSALCDYINPKVRGEMAASKQVIVYEAGHEDQAFMATLVNCPCIKELTQALLDQKELAKTGF